MTNEKHFPKNLSQWEFDLGLFANLWRIIVAPDFSLSSFKVKRGILLWQNTYPNLKTTCRIKLKFFLWTILLENLLLVKYLLSVTAPLSKYKKCFRNFCFGKHKKIIRFFIKCAKISVFRFCLQNLPELLFL